MGDEADRLPGVRMERQQLLVQMVAHDLVERAEGLIHQQQVCVEGERPGYRRPLLHASRKLPGKHAAEIAEADQVENAPDPLGPLLRGVAHHLERQAHILLDGPPGIEPGRLEHVAVGAVQPRLPRRHPVDRDRAVGRLLQVRDHPQQCRLPAARRADEADELARRHLQIDVRQRMHGPVIGLEDQVERGGGYRTCLAHPGLSPRLRAGVRTGGSRRGRPQTPLGMFNGSRWTLRGAVSSFQRASASCTAGKARRRTNRPRPGRGCELLPYSQTTSPRLSV